MVNVSVIMPIYNMEKYLEECLDSIINQTLNNIEIICVNDGSHDSSLDILMKYQKEYKNIIIINQENRGVASARNHGMEIANGEYLAFMDPDDKYPYADTLEKMYQAAIHNTALICGGSLRKMYGNKFIEQFGADEMGYTFTSEEMLSYQNYEFDYGFWRFIYSHKLLTDNNIKFPIYSKCEDPIFMVKAMTAAEKFYSIPEVTYQYRVGYKKVVLNCEALIDILRAYLEILQISKEKKLIKLHALSIKRINSFYSVIIRCLKDSEEISYLIKLYGKTLEQNWIIKEVGEDLAILNLLNDMETELKHVSDIRTLETEILSYDKIIIYGTGHMGMLLEKYLKNNNKKILGLAVSNKNYISPNANSNVKTIYEYKECFDDKLLVCVAVAEQHIEEVLELLSSIKVKVIVIKSQVINRLNYLTIPDYIEFNKGE